MKFFFCGLVVLFCTHLQAQYYYKDILGTQEASRQMRLYKENKVARVAISSFNETGSRSTDIQVTQEFDPAAMKLTTLTAAGLSAGSILVSSADAGGRLQSNFDSSGVIMSRTDYQYNRQNELISVSYQSSDTGRSLKTTDLHLWQWKDGKPKRMVRIKGVKDTTFIDFTVDENGNVVEETETHRGVKALPLYYYYNSSNQLTDIVRFNKRAQKLLPENLFEYTADGRLKQMITVPDNSPEYTIWVYQYNEKGLKIKEAIYSRQDKSRPVGRIQYDYEFR